MRLNEYLAVNQQMTVAGLREGTALWVENERITLRGTREMIILRYGQEPGAKKPGDVFGFNLR